MVGLGRETARECGLSFCGSLGAGIGELVVGIRIGGDIGGSMSMGCKFEPSNSLVIWLRSHLNKSGMFEVKLHIPCICDLCFQQRQIPITVVASKTNPTSICRDNCKPTGTLNG